MVKSSKIIVGRFSEKTPLETKEVFELLGVKNDKVKNSFNQIIIGSYSGKNSGRPFIILKTNYFPKAFEALNSWEDKMEQDLYPFFTPKGKSLLRFDEKTKFIDKTIENADVKVLVDKENTLRILYGFIDDKTIVITDSTQAFSELARRLRLIK